MRALDRGHVAQILQCGCGIWLMAAPGVFEHGSDMATSNYIAGPLLVMAGGIAVWEIARDVRLVALPVAAWLLIAPWLLDASSWATVNSMAVGIAAGALALVRGDPANSFGGGWSALWSSPSPYRDRAPGASGRPDTRKESQQL